MMEEKEILKALALPKATWIMRNFPFNKISSRLNTKSRQFLSNVIVTRGIRVLASINSNNTNIPRYENETERYEEIHIFLIKVVNLSHAKKIFRIFNNIIPYPLIVIFTDGTGFHLILGAYVKQPQKLFLKVTDLHEFNIVGNLTTYMAQIRFTKMNRSDLKTLYTSILEMVVNLELQKQYGITEAPSEEVNLLEKLNELDREIENLINKARKEKQMNRRIEYQIDANVLKQKRSKLLQGEDIDD